MRKRRRPWLQGGLAAGTALLLTATSVHCQDRGKTRQKTRHMRSVCARLRPALPPWQEAGDKAPTRAQRRFEAYFDLPQQRHQMGFLPFKGESIAVQRFDPVPPSRGTAILLHGYLDHSSLLGRPIRAFTDWGLTVVTYDMPGHGLSSGEAAAIDDFDDYGELLRRVITRVCPSSPRPLHLVAHSTGAVAVLGLLNSERDSAFHHSGGQVVLIAPLVYSWGTGPSKFGHALAKPFLSRVPRVQRRVSHDRKTMRMLRSGNPLRQTSVPLDWFAELREWQQRIHGWKPMPQIHPTILQGTGDTVVAWKKNLPLLKTLFPQASVHRVKGAFHHLLLENQQYSDPVYDVLRQTLAPKH